MVWFYQKRKGQKIAEHSIFVSYIHGNNQLRRIKIISQLCGHCKAIPKLFYRKKVIDINMPIL